MYRIVFSNDAKKDLCIVSMMKLLKFWFYLLSGTTISSQPSKKYYLASHKIASPLRLLQHASNKLLF